MQKLLKSVLIQELNAY